MVKVAFSPSDMGGVESEPRMPSSQPVQHIISQAFFSSWVADESSSTYLE